MSQTMNKTDLVKKLDLTGVPAKLQDEILAQLGENILTSVSLEVISRLTPDDRLSFEKLLKQDDTRGVEEFLNKKIPGIDDLVKEKTSAEIEAAQRKNNN